MSSGDVANAVLVVAVLAAVLVFLIVRVRRDAAREVQRVLPNPLADSPAVSATLAALAPQLAPGGSAGWLVVVLGSERAAVEAVVSSLQPGLPAEGDFSVNRLVGRAPVRLTGRVEGGVPVVTGVERLAEPELT
jgi:hypothetical protein